MQSKFISIKGCRVNNLKDVSVDIPRNAFVVITGLSGSGKSSLAFDTIYAEGQRRYMESLSSYARQFLDNVDKPDVDEIQGLSPVIAIDQKSTITNPRSTIGTITEGYDLLRLLFSKVGIPHCPECGAPVEKLGVEEIVNRIMKQAVDEKIFVLSPVIKGEKGNHKKIIGNIRRADFFQVRIDGEIYNTEELSGLRIDKNKKHNIEVVVDSFTLEDTEKMRERLYEVVQKALDLSNGTVVVQWDEWEDDMVFHQNLYCHACDITLPDVELKRFSFNSPHGACERCSGLGSVLEVDPELLIPNKKLTIAQGAIRPWQKIFANQPWYNDVLEQIAKKYTFSLDIPVEDMSQKHLHTLLYGEGEEVEYKVGKKTVYFTGVIPMLEDKYKETDSDYIRKEVQKFMRVLVCPSCHGKRLKPDVLAITVGGHSISDITELSIVEILNVLDSIAEDKKASKLVKKVAQSVIDELRKRLNNLMDVGLGYLTLDRPAVTLSGGEAQRIRLAKQLSSNLSEVIYVLDEPSIGLHPRDNERLIKTMLKLRDQGNTVIVVEHDEEIMRRADFVIDVGPAAGNYGGKIVFAGDYEEMLKTEKSLTAAYLTGEKTVIKRAKKKRGNGSHITIKNASGNNLDNVTVDIPLKKMVCVSGVSGSGKSTLIIDTLARHLNQKFYRAKDIPEPFEEITGIDELEKIITIDQSPIGRTPRSNPATYTGVFTHIRDLYAGLKESQLKGFEAGMFSFNVKGGRCDHCEGEGMMKIDMQFLPDVYVECEECKGRRYKREVLEIFYQGKNIADILDMNVKEALRFFEDIPVIREKLQTLFDVGLGYIHLGQSATTLSGGEAQRVKLATELSRRANGNTLYILDEPTTGLHFDDIKRLLDILHKLVDKGSTVLMIEHNLDIIASADHVIDVGPDGGDQGGKVVFEGTPEELAESKTLTGASLKKHLETLS
jgi:excinuclease ABC subunit A